MLPSRNCYFVPVLEVERERNLTVPTIINETCDARACVHLTRADGFANLKERAQTKSATVGLFNPRVQNNHCVPRFNVTTLQV